MQTTKATNILKTLSGGTRFKIIKLLIKAEGDLCVNEISSAIKMSHSATSHQLTKLEDRGIVKSFRMGQTICYELTNPTITKELLNIVEQFD